MSPDSSDKDPIEEIREILLAPAMAEQRAALSVLSERFEELVARADRIDATQTDAQRSILKECRALGAAIDQARTQSSELEARQRELEERIGKLERGSVPKSVLRDLLSEATRRLGDSE